MACLPLRSLSDDKDLSSVKRRYLSPVQLTRFSQESLDAVVEKTTGRKEAEAAKGKCAACGHSTMIEGRVQGGGRLIFQPERTRFWTFEESLVTVKARTCAACGNIQMHADTDKLNRLRPEEDEQGAE